MTCSVFQAGQDLFVAADADPVVDVLSRLVSEFVGKVPALDRMEAAATRMREYHRERLGIFCPTSDLPRNPYETKNGIAEWNIQNVFAGSGSDDMCQQLISTLSKHSSTAVSGQCRVALVGPSGCGKTFVLRHLARAVSSVDSASCVEFVIDMDFSGA